MGQSIFSNAIVATLGRIVTLACGLAATALMTRILNVNEFGGYSFILTIAIILQLSADFGLYLTLSRELGVSHGKPNETITNIASLRLTLLIVLFGLVLVGFLVLPSIRMYMRVFLLLAIGLIFQSGSQLLMSIFQAYGCIWRATIGDIVGRVVQVAALAVGFFVFPTAVTILWVAGAFTAGLTIAFGIHILLLPEKRLLRMRISRKMWGHIIRISWPIALMLILNGIYFRIDTVLLSLLRTTQEVGLYSLAYKIIENGLFFPAMIGGLLLPAITSALVHHDTRRSQELITQGLTLSLSGACILVAVLIAFANDIILLLAPASFVASAPLLQILALALGSMFLGNIFGFSVIALGKQKDLAILYGVLVLGNIVLNLFLIPLYGAFAAAWVTVATEITATLVAAIIVRRHIPWRLPLRSSAPILISALVSVGLSAILLADSSISVRLGVTFALYGAMMHWCGVWSRIKI